jgi:hypothetical protein
MAADARVMHQTITTSRRESPARLHRTNRHVGTVRTRYDKNLCVSTGSCEL